VGWEGADWVGRDWISMCKTTNNSDSSNIVRGKRQTNRKRRIREALETTFNGRAVLLDELRWTVMGPQFVSNIDDAARRSLMNSFARTVREQLPDYVIEKLRIARRTAVGIVARAAVYRMKDVDALRRFLTCTDACVLCRYKTNIDADEPHYEPLSRYVVARYHAATFRFFNRRPSKLTYEEVENTPGTYIPATQKLSLVVPRGKSAEMLSVAAVPWKLFGYDDLNDWHEVDGNDPLLLVHRDRRQ